MEVAMIKILLKQLLNKKNMTQSEFSEITKIRPSTICDLCNNNTISIKVEHLERICEALKCEITDVLILL